jgi:prepilin-type N-terminal cleavage/methylation domain-containing protein
MKIVKKGFTLIELMIVIAIIWVLAVTIVPKLTWAQARARDAGRIADLKSVSAALETYNNDEWEYPEHPAADTPNWCLSSSEGVLNDTDLSAMLKWEKAPLDQQKQRTASPCGTTGSYWYVTLRNGWTPRGWYALIANLENYKKANYDPSKIGDLKKDWSSTYKTIAWNIKTIAWEPSNKKQILYVEINN